MSDALRGREQENDWGRVVYLTRADVRKERLRCVIFGQPRRSIYARGRWDHLTEADYVERLRRLALSDTRSADADRQLESEPVALDPKSLELVRLAALIAVGGALSSFGAQVDRALVVGASATEIVDVLVGVIPALGLPRIVSAAPSLALALGHDIEAEFS